MHSLHAQALKLSREHHRIENDLVFVLREIEEIGLFRTLHFSSLFTYGVSALGLSEAATYALITVARKTREVRALDVALTEQRLSVHRASRIVSVLTVENSESLIAYAAAHSQRETDQEVARIRGRASEARENLNISRETLVLIKKARALLSSRKKRNVKLDESLQYVLTEFIERHDPVRKAQSAARRPERRFSPRETTSNSVQTNVTLPISRRKRILAAVKHAVHLRDGGRCTFVDLQGNRCGNEQWLHFHHIQAVSKGGANDIANLTTLCSFHHDLVHQLSLGIEGQVSWLRSPAQSYH